MGRWLGWVGKTVATALLLSFLSIWTTGYIVNSYMETLLKQLNVPLQMQPFALSGVWGKLWGARPISQMEEARDGTSSNEERGASAAAGDRAESSRKPADEADSLGRSDADRMTGEASGGRSYADDARVATEGNDAGASETGESVPTFGGSVTRVPEMTAEQRQLLQSVMAKLNGEQLTQLARYLEDGMTAAELAAVGELVAPSLTETEYRQLMELFVPATAATAGEQDSQAQ